MSNGGILTNTSPKVGVYYFPGWCTPNGGGPQPSNPWGLIPSSKYPLNGPYDEKSRSVVELQLKQMVDAGIDFVSVVFFWPDDSTQYLEHWLDLYYQYTGPKPKFCLMFDNNGSVFTPAIWQNCYTYLVNKYFGDPNYFKINGKPLITMFNIDQLRVNLGGGTTAGVAAQLALASAAENTARGNGGIHFSGNSYEPPFDNGGSNSVFSMGFNSVTSYNFTGSSTTWADQMNLYYTWYAQAAQRNHPAILPVCSGYDNTPWGGSLISAPTNAEFLAHLKRAKYFAKTYSKTNTVIVCAWNEYGEGQVIEPSLMSNGFGRLQQLQAARDI